LGADGDLAKRRCWSREGAEAGRVLAGVGFTLVTITACVLLGQRLTHSSWPLAHARMELVVPAALCYFVSFILRARGWRRLFPTGQQPDQARCLASVGAAAASGAVLPFRLDYLVKIGTLRRLGGVRVGLEAISAYFDVPADSARSLCGTEGVRSVRILLNKPIAACRYA
jgi:hypothetical protein